jgi:ABC-type lipoprotein export system ATPase subunit
MEMLQVLNRQGLTVILVTHEPHIADYAARKLALVDGRLVADQQIANAA